jgi:hypothetical protein
LEGEHPSNPIVVSSDEEEEGLEGEHPSNPIVISSDDEEVEEEDPQPPVITPPPSPEYGGDLDEDLEYYEISRSLDALVHDAEEADMDWIVPALEAMIHSMEEDMDQE